MRARLVVHDPATVRKMQLTTSSKAVSALDHCTARGWKWKFTFDQLANYVSNTFRLIVPPHLKEDLLDVYELTLRIHRKRVDDAGYNFSDFNAVTIPVCQLESQVGQEVDQNI